VTFRSARDNLPFRKGIWPLTDYLLAVLCAALCWNGVRWATGSGSFLMLDELGNLSRYLGISYRDMITFFPQWIYNDRPIGFAIERLLFDAFGFDYRRQLVVFLVIHFGNCALGFLLFRRLGVSRPLSIAAIALYGSLWTTAETATYIGAVFDVVCLLFLLGSTLAILSDRRGANVVSAVLFLLALRTKEFAIVVPVLFLILALYLSPNLPLRQSLGLAVRRVWMHLWIGAIFAIRYLLLIPRMGAEMGPGNPYYMNPDPVTILHSLSYYTAWIFGSEDTVLPRHPFLLAFIFGAILLYGLYGRRIAVVFGLAAYVVTLLPVTMISNREPYYLYAPQLFLILLAAGLVEDLIRTLKGEQPQRVAFTGVAVAAMAAAAMFQRSSYFKDRVNFFVTVRHISKISSIDASRLLPELAPESHIYVNHHAQTPWLFIPGPCDFFKLAKKDRSIFCILNKPEDELRTLYSQDDGPKYFLRYDESGALGVVDARVANP